MIHVSGVVRGWSIQPQVVAPLVLTAGLYLYAVRVTQLRHPRFQWKASRTACFVGGVAVLAVALGSQVRVYSDRLLSAHMGQHIALMQVAPPLLLLGRPITLTLAASSGKLRSRLSSVAHGRMGRALGSPVVGFGCFAVVLWGAHFTPLYEAALTNQVLHGIEHLAFAGKAAPHLRA